uniref:RING-type domain-containing protein n=1 Tax=Bursaphelenchus xylophilus TaxID=6326 RepID=A0A1I7SIR5_BURXY
MFIRLDTTKQARWLTFHQSQNFDEPQPQASQQVPEEQTRRPLSIRRNARTDGFPAGPERQQDTEATQKLREWAERFRARRDQLKKERDSEVVVVSETECTICFDKARNPTSCKACKQIIGCQRCIRNWIRTQADSNKAPSCPLCRGDGFANFELFD